MKESRPKKYRTGLMTEKSLEQAGDSRVPGTVLKVWEQRLEEVEIRVRNVTSQMIAKIVRKVLETCQDLLPLSLQ